MPTRKSEAEVTTTTKKKAERRSPARLARPRVLVTGAASSLGRALCRRLHRTFDVLAVDTRPFPDRPKDVEHAEIDLRRKAAQTRVKKRRPELVVHLGPLHDEKRGRGTILETTATLLQLVEDLGAKKLVVLSSASLYGPSPTSAAFLSEDAPLLGGQRSRAIADAIAVDMMVQSFFWKAPATETVILRPVHVVGPHLNNLPSRFLRLRRAPVLLGFDPMMQLVHEDDLVDAVALALAPGCRGVFNVVGPTQAPLSRILASRRAQAVPLPGFLLGPALVRARALRLTRLDASELVHLKYSCLVDGNRAATGLGFAPRRGLLQTLADLGA
jgi:UDP-glucose 4-epimerase